MPFLIWLQTREALSQHQHNNPQNLAAQVSYMSCEQYDWALADWLDAEARSPLCTIPKQQSHVHREEYRYDVAWEAGTSTSSKPEHPDNIVHRSQTCRLVSASWGPPERKQRLDTLMYASIHASQNSVPGTVASRRARVPPGCCHAAQPNMSRR